MRELLFGLLGGTLIGVSRRPPLDYTFQAGLYDSESWVGAQRDVTGLLVEGPIYMGGGFFRFSRNLPLETFQPALLANRIFNYAAVADGRAEESWCKQAGFQRVFGTRGWSVWKRAAGPAPPGVR